MSRCVCGVCVFVREFNVFHVYLRMPGPENRGRVSVLESRTDTIESVWSHIG